MTLRLGPARVVDATDIRMPGKAKAPFYDGELLEIRRLTKDGGHAVTSKHPGWFPARRFQNL